MLTSRRAFFRRAGLVTASAAAVPALVRSAQAAATAPGARPRHIIQLVSDGTSSGTWTLADHFSTLTRGRGLRFFELLGQPGVSATSVNMRSLNSLVTDSAAASSSWGCGSRVVNGALNCLPDGRPLRTLYSLFAEIGWKRGLVTTTEITHATPAGFATNCPARGNANDIAVQYLERKVEVLLGGGSTFFDPAKRKDKRDLRAEFRAAGYIVMERAGELEQAPLDRPWLGTFYPSHLPYTLDWRADRKLRDRVPSLAAMTRRALARLERADHFILQVEGGRVDHAAHANDITTAVHDLVAFDEALEACLDFQGQNPDTLIVITTDHGTANPGLNGTGKEYGQSSPLFAHTLKVSRSFESLAPELKKITDVAALQRLLAEATGYKVPEAKAALFLTAKQKKTPVLYDGMNGAEMQLGQLQANYLGVGFTSGAHTADFVPLFALGPGAERFRRFLQNTDVFHHYLALAGIDFRNPMVPLMAEAGPSAADVEDIPALV
jgi:alkaline phosphatase